jgi:hypothetical protein
MFLYAEDGEVKNINEKIISMQKSKGSTKQKMIFSTNSAGTTGY